jgi:predicted nucleic acid-binding protein
VIVADTGAVVALIDRDDRHHTALRAAFESAPDEWILPWAILPEVDHIVRTRLSAEAARAFAGDVAEGAFAVDWGGNTDLRRAAELDVRYADLELGLVDAVVMAIAERLGAPTIATLDLRDFGAVELAGRPALWPRDLTPPTEP